MRKSAIIILSVCMLLSICGCGNQEQVANEVATNVTVFEASEQDINSYVEYTGEIIYVPYRELVPIYKPYFYVHTIYSYLLSLSGF